MEGLIKPVSLDCAEIFFINLAGTCRAFNVRKMENFLWPKEI